MKVGHADQDIMLEHADSSYPSVDTLKRGPRNVRVCYPDQDVSDTCQEVAVTPGCLARLLRSEELTEHPTLKRGVLPCYSVGIRNEKKK